MSYVLIRLLISSTSEVEGGWAVGGRRSRREVCSMCRKIWAVLQSMKHCMWLSSQEPVQVIPKLVYTVLREMGGFHQLRSDIIYSLACILTALACAILRTGFNPSFSIFFMTGTYDIGMTSTGIPFLNCNSHKHTQASIASPKSGLFYLYLQAK